VSPLGVKTIEQSTLVNLHGTLDLIRCLLVFPRPIATCRLPTRRLAALVQRAVPVLAYLETIIHPRRPIPIEMTKRIVGIVVVVLSILLFVPIPLSNVVPALVIALISLAYLEEDGVLLAIALLAAVIVMTVMLAVVWETILGALSSRSYPARSRWGSDPACPADRLIVEQPVEFPLGNAVTLARTVLQAGAVDNCDIAP
jgi:hypothetical protein